ncbi:hypothetical protein [Chamaesiphon sp. OTE_8_metabat_110]|uniref:hypothetical protein n=1 Tax=Chamaesiphon sp. OTE_8_metabat_110 TaxID=2964696 RepID=UPI00286A3E52|nr:hypothetical protein [Chamaesiphon sp. OTE_8_metabat_110]
MNDVVQAWTEYLKITEEEKTKRSEIEAWENITLAEIQAKRDFLINYLDRSFDERAKNFQSLFQKIDRAMSSDDNQQLGLALNAIVDLAKSSPFHDLSNLSIVQAALDDPEYVWEL